MKKRYGKYLALALAGSLLLPSAAPMAAWAADSVGSTGDSVIETDNSELPKLKRVVLPTIAEDTYDFIIDVEGLMKKTVGDSLKDGDSNTDTVFFNVVKSKATFELPTLTTEQADTEFSFVVFEQAEDTGLARLKKALGLADDGTPVAIGNVATALNGQYYVWQPDPAKVSTTGEGMWTQITKDNYTKFLKVTADETGKLVDDVEVVTGNLVGATADIFDGKIYVLTEKQLGSDAATGAEEVVEKYYADGKISSDVKFKVTPNKSVVDKFAYATVTLGKAGTSAAYTASETAPKVTLVYKEAEYHYTGQTEAVEITNKSTFDIAVTAQVNVKDHKGLKFVVLDDIASDTGEDTATANVVIGVADATEPANVAYAVTKGGTDDDLTTLDDNVLEPGVVRYILKGTSTGTTETSNTYQNTEEINDKTGGHNYYQFLNPGLDYSSAEFVLTAQADATGFGNTPEEYVTAAWEAYVAGLADETYKKPTIDVVYKFEEVNVKVEDGTPSTTDFVGVKTGATYTVSDVTIGGFVAADAYAALSAVKITFTQGTLKTETDLAVTTAVTEVVPGTEMILTYAPGEGNVVGSITFEDEHSESVAVEVVNNGDGTYSFAMPTVATTMTINEVTPGFTSSALTMTYGTDQVVAVNPAGVAIAAVKYSTTAYTDATNPADSAYSKTMTLGKDYTVNTATGEITLLGTGTVAALGKSASKSIAIMVVMDADGDGTTENYKAGLTISPASN